MANPFILGPATSSSSAATLPEFREYVWDFAKSCFVYNDDGSHKIVARNEAIKVWCHKALLTERHRFRAYFDDYGAELEHFIGTVTNDDVEAYEVYRYVEEALLVNTYILVVQVASIEQNGKQYTLNINLRTVYGDATLEIEV